VILTFLRGLEVAEINLGVSEYYV